MNLMNEMKFMVAFELIKYLEPLQPFNLTHSILKEKVFSFKNENGVDWAGSLISLSSQSNSRILIEFDGWNEKW